MQGKLRKVLLGLTGIILPCLLLFTACSEKEPDSRNVCQIFYISYEETKVESRDYVMQSEETREQLEELLQCLSAIPEKLEYKAPLSMGFTLLSYDLTDGKLLLDVDDKYKDLSATTETLVRAALVKTLTQLTEINFIGITVNGNPLYDNLNNLVGWMFADQFISNEGNEINTYEKVRLKLYFTNEDGNTLIAVNTAELRYNSNRSLEKLVVEELIKGPNAGTAYAALNPDTKVISVMVKDGICYVNLDENFLIQSGNATAEATWYSIVNSLTELSNVNKVQIFINGDSSGTFREKFSFSAVYERNLDIVAAEVK